MHIIRSLAPLALALILMSCGRDKKGGSKDALGKDTALARDLRRAKADTSAYGDAADVAMRDVPESTAYHPAGPVRMRDVATAKPRRDTPPPPAAMTTDDPAPRNTRQPTVEHTFQPGPPKQSPPSGANPCDSPEKSDQRRCLMSYLARSDAELDRTYQALISEMKHRAGAAAGDREPDAVLRLREAQRAWLIYRDTECRRRNRGTEGPLWAPVRARCLGEFSGQRAGELAGSLATLRGT